MNICQEQTVLYNVTGRRGSDFFTSAEVLLVPRFNLETENIEKGGGEEDRLPGTLRKERILWIEHRGTWGIPDWPVPESCCMEAWAPSNPVKQ